MWRGCATSQRHYRQVGKFAFLQERLGQRSIRSALIWNSLRTFGSEDCGGDWNQNPARVGLGSHFHSVKICKHESLNLGTRMHERPHGSPGRPFVISFTKRAKRLLPAKIKSQASRPSPWVHWRHVILIVDVVGECKTVGGQKLLISAPISTRCFN